MNVIIVRSLIVESHSNEHAVVNYKCQECGIFYTGVIKTGSI